MTVIANMKVLPGTAVVWGHPSGSGVTANMSLNALANNAGQMGVAVDLGSAYDVEQQVFLWHESGATPTAGNVGELYFACSHDNTNWPGVVNGADAAYPGTINSNKLLLGPPVTCLVANNVATNTAQYQQPVLWRPRARYVVPVYLNFTGGAIRNAATAANNLSRVILVPAMLQGQT